jgi:hypothetical protein
VGCIDDLIIMPDRALSSAILSVGGFLGFGRRPVAIPVEQFRDVQGRITLGGDPNGGHFHGEKWAALCETT